MMIGVAIAAPFFLLLRGDEEERQIVAGALIVYSCVMVLAWKLTIETIAREASGVGPIGRWRKVRIALSSSAIALLVIVFADLMFLVVYTFVDLVFSGRQFGAHEIGLKSFLFSVLLAVFMTARLRRAIRKKQEDRDRQRSPAAPPIEVNPDEWPISPGDHA